MRIQIALTGRVNAGKSTLLNLISGQESAITSAERGTTTDIVEKAMELRPLGAVLLLDTAGIDDTSVLGAERRSRTAKAVDRADCMVIVTTPGVWGEYERELLEKAKSRKIPALTVINKADTAEISSSFRELIAAECGSLPLEVSAFCENGREEFLRSFTSLLLKLLPDDALQPPPLLRDLLPEGSLVVMMTPIDIQAPRGRLILPQVQAIRDVLDGHSICVTAREDAFPEIYSRFTALPDLVVCDSQVVSKMISTLPPGVMCTTFSILFARQKGDLEQLSLGAAAIASLRPGDRVMIAEACTHHASDDDIGRVKIPRLLEKTAGGELDIQIVSGLNFPEDISGYKLVVHCGGCMLNRRAMLNRLAELKANAIPVVNYGVCISFCSGVLEKVLSPFPGTAERFRSELDKHR